MEIVPLITSTLRERAPRAEPTYRGALRRPLHLKNRRAASDPHRATLGLGLYRIPSRVDVSNTNAQRSKTPLGPPPRTTLKISSVSHKPNLGDKLRGIRTLSTGKKEAASTLLFASYLQCCAQTWLVGRSAAQHDDAFDPGSDSMAPTAAQSCRAPEAPGPILHGYKAVTCIRPDLMGLGPSVRRRPKAVFVGPQP